MVKYTNPELTDMVLIYGEALSNADATRRLYEGYMKRFPSRQVPCLRTFVNAVQHLRDYGTVLLTKNQMVVADDLHYDLTFPVLQFGERCTNRDYIRIIFNASNT
jgi:hypothetical protein